MAQMFIKAPAGGTVTDIFVTLGQFVAPSATIDQASILLVLADLDDLFVELIKSISGEKRVALEESQMAYWVTRVLLKSLVYHSARFSDGSRLD